MQIKFFKVIADTKLKKIIISTIAVLLALPVVFYAADSLINMNKIHYGVLVNSQNVGGLSAGKAVGKLEKSNSRLASMPITVHWDTQSWQLDPKDVYVEFKTKEAVENAAKIGNTGSLANRFRQKINAWRGNININLKLSFNDKPFDDFLSKLSSSIDRQAVNPAVVIKGSEASVVKGQTGLLLSKNASMETIEKAILSQFARTQKLPVLIIPTAIKYESAVKAAKKANDMMSAPVDIKYSDSSWGLTKEEITGMIKFEEKTAIGKSSLEASIDTEKVITKIGLLAKDVPKEPQDAKFSVVGEKVAIIPSKEGIIINLEKAAGDLNLAAIKKDPAQREVLLTGTISTPKLTTEKAQSMGIKEKITSYTTKYSPYARARVSNIHLLTKTLDGVIVAPGDVFSFNKTIGPRTAVKGYKEASIILNGKLVPGLGGGVCQVATTMFNTIFFAGLPVAERRNHSFYISKYPTGRDATVSYPYPDLKFKNDTGAYILIKGYVSSNSVTINFYGTDPDRTVTYNTTGFSGITAFPVEKVEDSTLEEGIEKIVDLGEAGRQVTVYRTVKKDSTILFKDTFFSKYRPKIQVVIYGTKVKPTESPSTAPTTSASTIP